MTIRQAEYILRWHGVGDHSFTPEAWYMALATLLGERSPA